MRTTFTEALNCRGACACMLAQELPPKSCIAAGARIAAGAGAGIAAGAKTGNLHASYQVLVYFCLFFASVLKTVSPWKHMTPCVLWGTSDAHQVM